MNTIPLTVHVGTVSQFPVARQLISREPVVFSYPVLHVYVAVLPNVVPVFVANTELPPVTGGS